MLCGNGPAGVKQESSQGGAGEPLRSNPRSHGVLKNGVPKCR